MIRGAARHGGQFRNTVLGPEVGFQVIQNQLKGGAVQSVRETASVFLLGKPGEFGAEEDQEKLPRHQLHAFEFKIEAISGVI